MAGSKEFLLEETETDEIPQRVDVNSLDQESISSYELEEINELKSLLNE